MLSIIGVTLAGHYGASLTHGPDYLTEVLRGAMTTTFRGIRILISQVSATLPGNFPEVR